MITKEQCITGCVKYIDNEIIPLLPSGGKFVLGTITILAANKSGEVINELVRNPMIKALGAVDEKGLINDELLIDALHESSSKYGPLKLDVPLIGSLTFKDNDIVKLGQYMRGM